MWKEHIFSTEDDIVSDSRITLYSKNNAKWTACQRMGSDRCFIREDSEMTLCRKRVCWYYFLFGHWKMLSSILGCDGFLFSKYSYINKQGYSLSNSLSTYIRMWADTPCIFLASFIHLCFLLNQRQKVREEKCMLMPLT